jgi:putative transposase
VDPVLGREVVESEQVIDILGQAIVRWGIPASFNTDQGSQFTVVAVTSVLKAHGIKISMDGVKRALDSIYVERLWRSLKYEEI